MLNRAKNRFLAMVFGGIAAALGVRAADADPYAINPFRVQYRRAPTDPALRWAGFQSRVGTYLPTDQYHWWRFNVGNRAEVQDAFWQVQAVADTVKGDWNGSWPITPGDKKQVWRDAFMRCLNLQRYYYMGADTTYLEEDTNPTWRLGLQAAALIEGNRVGGYTHSLKLSDMPAGFQYGDEAIFWAAHSSLGWTIYPSDITAFLQEGGNVAPGHRLEALNPGANLFTFGQVGPNPTGKPESTRPYSSIVYYSTDTTTVYQSGINFGNPNPGTVPPPPQFDPFSKVRFYPYNGYVTVDDIGQGGTIPISLEVPAAGLILDTSAMQITVVRDGVPIQVSQIQDAFHLSWRQTVAFTAALGYFPYDGPAYKAVDSTVIVTVSGLKFKSTLAFTPSGKDTDMAPYLALCDPRCFEPHTLTWSFTVFDPATVQSVPPPISRSEITNLSTRAPIGAGDNVLIAGFVVAGSDPLRVALRAQGPGLGQYGIQHPAINPRIELYQPNATTSFGSNEDWKSGATWRLVQSYGLNPTDDREPVAIATLMPGSYTAIVSDPANPGLGVGIVEVFAFDAESQDRLINVSTRALIGSGENLLIAGFILQQATTVVVRTRSPSLARFGLKGVNATKLTIVRQSDHVTLATNIGWNAAGAIGNQRLSGDLAGYAPLDAREAAQVITLPAGAYTALVESPDGTTGVGIVEVFKID